MSPPFYSSRLRSVVCLCGLTLLVSTGLTPSLRAGGSFLVYPRSEETPNPRVPVVPPVAQGGVGLGMAVETDFTYELSPFVDFSDSGRVDVLLRDNARRERKEVVELVDGDLKLALCFDRASSGRVPLVVLSRGREQLGVVPLGAPWGDVWKAVRLQWSQARLTVALDGHELGALDLPAGFSPKRLAIQVWHVDELKIEGRGKFQLGWENGYAASVEPKQADEASQARLFGFDAYAVDDRTEKRDCPMLQVLNGGGKPREVTFDFDLRGEVTGVHQVWTQKVSAAGRATTMSVLRFPEPLADDVYHLKVVAQGLTKGLDTEVHFFSAARRDEPAGPSKFGLHDSGSQLFGFWPDALGINFAHVYSYWGYVVGPAWVKDFNGDFGIDPATDPKEWAWNRRVDWLIGQGLTPYVSLQSEPFLPWMRAHNYPKQKLQKKFWGDRGGHPKVDLYRQFVRALAERYKGRVLNYEVENEPNARGNDQIPPEEYVHIAQAVFEEVHAVDPKARVFGICGTGNFVPWMTTVFENGGAKFMDGVSIHTYVTPQLPEQANLPGKLAEVNALIAKTGRAMPVLNSETGTYVALREQVDQPIPADRLKTLIDAGTPGLSIATGWPNYAVTERVGSLSIVRNVVYNFLAGQERFVFFGWNAQWPGLDWAKTASGQPGFALISATMDGVRTPSQHTLAIGVLTAQLRGAIVKGARSIEEGGVLGGVFPKANGGEVAVLWSALGTRSILLESADKEIEMVSVFGQRRISRSSSIVDKLALHSIELGDEPVYVHLKRPGVAVRPSPVLNVRQVNRDNGGIQVEFTLVNRTKRTWSDQVEFAPQQNWRFEPERTPFSLKPGERASFTIEAVASGEGDRKARSVTGLTRLSDGSRFSFPVGLVARPVVALAALPDAVGVDVFRGLSMPGGHLRLYRPEQVMIGRPPQLASLQEDQYWRGSAELAGDVKIGGNARGLYVYVDVIDSLPHAPNKWPDVRGSSVELFFDFRAAGSGFGGRFGPGAYQVVLKPSLKVGEPVQIWNASSGKGEIADTVALGTPSERGYRVMFHIPWASVGRTADDRTPFGFDVGINGPTADGGDRKSQLMLFGTGSNNADAANYGLAITPTK